MGGQSKHDRIANRIAKKKGTEYNKGQGPDVVTPTQAIEVATSETDLKESLRQLQGFKKSRYLATTPELVKEALEIAEGTGVGVMGPTGQIRKRAGAKRKG